MLGDFFYFVYMYVLTKLDKKCKVFWLIIIVI